MRAEKKQKWDRKIEKAFSCNTQNNIVQCNWSYLHLEFTQNAHYFHDEVAY